MGTYRLASAYRPLAACQVVVESGAGALANFSDADYKAAGATIADGASAFAQVGSQASACPPPPPSPFSVRRALAGPRRRLRGGWLGGCCCGRQALQPLRPSRKAASLPLLPSLPREQDIVLKVRPPSADKEVAMFREGSRLISFLYPAQASRCRAH